MVHWPRGVSNKGGHRFNRGEFSVRPRRARAHARVLCVRAKSRRLRICSLCAGAVRQFTITTGVVGSARRPSPNL